MASATRPLIGINVDLVPARQQTGAYLRLDAGHAEAVARAGGVPVLLPPLVRPDDLDAVLDRVAGFVLSGGREAGGELPVGGRDGPCGPGELALVGRLLTRRVPLLAVGRGMLQLSAACGGSLTRHLPGDAPYALAHRGADPGHRHPVLLEPGSRLAALHGGGEVRVAGGHRQAVRRPGAGLRVAARAPDGAIEAVEGIDPDWFLVGVQWQPFGEAASVLDRRLVEELVRACAVPAAPARLRLAA